LCGEQWNDDEQKFGFYETFFWCWWWERWWSRQRA